MGRKKKWDARILVPMTTGMLARIVEVAPDEERTAFIRDAIENEIRRRERQGVGRSALTSKVALTL